MKNKKTKSIMGRPRKIDDARLVAIRVPDEIATIYYAYAERQNTTFSSVVRQLLESNKKMYI